MQPITCIGCGVNHALCVATHITHRDIELSKRNAQSTTHTCQRSYFFFAAFFTALLFFFATGLRGLTIAFFLLTFFAGFFADLLLGVATAIGLADFDDFFLPCFAY